MSSDYDDIINLPHYHDPSRPFMPASERAAQFMPFKSLNGYHEEISAAEREIGSTEWEVIDRDI